MKRHVFSSEDLLHIIEDYRSGKSSNEIAKRHGVTSTTILNILHRSGVTVREASRKGQSIFTPEEADNIVKAYQDGTSSTVLTTRYGCTRNTIIRVLKNAGVKIRGPMGQRKHIFSPEEMAEWAREYEKGSSVKAIAQRHGTYRKLVSSVLKSSGITIRGHRRPTVLSPDIIAEWVREYEGGSTMLSIAKRYNTSNDRVRRVLTRSGVKLRSISNLSHALYAQKTYCSLNHPLERAAIDVIRLATDLKEGGVDKVKPERYASIVGNAFLPNNYNVNQKKPMMFEMILRAAEMAEEFLKTQLDKDSVNADISLIDGFLYDSKG
jgi:transposase-like protein